MKTLSWGIALCVLWTGGWGCSPPSGSVVTSPPHLSSAKQWLEQGQRLAQQGSAARAEEYLLAAWAEGVPSHDVLPLLLPMCLSEGRLRTALEYAQRARRSDPRDPRLLQISISLHMALGHKVHATREIETLALIAPQYKQAVYFLGEQFFQLGQTERAKPYLQHYKDTWPQAPDVPWVNHLLARIAQDQQIGEQWSASATSVPMIPSQGELPEGDRP